MTPGVTSQACRRLDHISPEEFEAAYIYARIQA
ncbi:MAG: hypothetical protein JWR37_4156, partial [Mycobacterium sp.]|nr:hypothetical protein [Mycobacterium sp.]